MSTITTDGPAILSSLDAVNQELQAIGKNQQGYGYKFRGIDDVLNTLNPLFKKHKILTRREGIQCDRVVRKNDKDKSIVEVFVQCEYVFTSLIDGTEFRSAGFGEGQDSSGGDKASSMATSNTYKYVIFEMFNIATDEQRDSDQVTAKSAGSSKRGSAYRKTKETDDVL